MRRLVPLVSVCLLLSAAAESAFAQQRAFVFANQNILEVETSPAFGRVIRLIPWSSPYEIQDATPIAAGAFVIWTRPDRGIFVLDVQRGSIHQVTILGVPVGRVIGTDETTFRVLLLTAGRVLVLDLRTGSIRAIDVGDQLSTAGVVHAARPNLLFVAWREEPLSRIDVISVDTGMIVKRLTVPPLAGAFLQSVSPSGTRLYLWGTGGLTVVDTITGALVGTIPLSTGIYGAPVIDEDRNRLLVTGSGPDRPSQYLAAFSLDSMQPLGRIETSALGLPPAYLFDVSPHSATMLALHESACSGCSPVALTGLHVDSGRLRATADLPGLGFQLYDRDIALVRLTEPSAPRNFAVNVTGNRVELTWAPAGALRYEVEAGSAPGLSNLAILGVNDTQLVVDGVPSGTYHLRVRAINTIGTSVASQGIQVVVP